MTPRDCITALFDEIDEQRCAMPQHPEAHLWPRAVVPLGRWPARQGVGNRAGSRCVPRAERPVFPHGPERPRLFRLCRTPQDGPQAVVAAPTVRGVIDT